MHLEKPACKEACPIQIKGINIRKLGTRVRGSGEKKKKGKRRGKPKSTWCRMSRGDKFSEALALSWGRRCGRRGYAYESRKDGSRVVKNPLLCICFGCARQPDTVQTCRKFGALLSSASKQAPQESACQREGPRGKSPSYRTRNKKRPERDKFQVALKQRVRVHPAGGAIS